MYGIRPTHDHEPHKHAQVQGFPQLKCTSSAQSTHRQNKLKVISMLRNLSRLKKELKLLIESPGPGVSAAPVDGNILELLAIIVGPEDSPYAAGTFQLSLKIPENYPFEPPKAQFITPIYHPNIDSEGRICLDTLKPQPQGSWAPSITLNTLLLSIRLLLMHPNADDGLVPDITELFRRDHAAYKDRAKQHTLQYSILHNADSIGSGCGSGRGEGSNGDANHSPAYENSGDSLSNARSGNSKEKPLSITVDATVAKSTQTAVSDQTEQIFYTSSDTQYTDDAYEYVADGYTLIGCVPGSSGEILYISDEDDCVQDDAPSSDSATDFECEGSSKGNKRQRVA